MNDMVAGDRHANWFGRLSPVQRRSFWAAFGGNSLDNLDFSLFSFLVPTLIATWGMTRGEAGLIAASTTITGALGGVLAGTLADRYGRVAVLQGTILWFSAFTFLCGFAQSPDQLLALRALQGLGFGGELAVGAVLIGESVAAHDRGKIMGGVASGYAIGAIGASALYAAAFLLLPPETAWRAALWLGILPALLVLYVRKGVREPEVFASTERMGMWTSFKTLFTGSLLLRTLLAVVLVAGITGTQLTLAIWLPTWLRTERGLTVLNTSTNAIIGYIGSFIGFLIGGYLVDRLGRRNSFRWFAVITFVSVCFYLFFPMSNAMLRFVGGPVGVVLVVMGVGMTPYLTELFPTAVRASGLGLCYSLGRALGALAPIVVGVISKDLGVGSAMLWLMSGCLLLVIISASLLPREPDEVANSALR